MGKLDSKAQTAKRLIIILLVSDCILLIPNTVLQFIHKGGYSSGVAGIIIFFITAVCSFLALFRLILIKIGKPDIFNPERIRITLGGCIEIITELIPFMRCTVMLFRIAGKSDNKIFMFFGAVIIIYCFVLCLSRIILLEERGEIL